MKSFIKYSIIFLLTFFILEKGLIFLRNKLPEKELDKRLELLITGKVNANIIVMGSSRGARDIIASQLSDSFKTSAYNLSYPGSNIFFHEYLLQELLKHPNKKPTLIILAVDDAYELKVNPSINFRLDRLYPLVKYKDIRNTLIEKGEKNKYLSALLIVHQLSISNLDLRTKHFKDQDTLLADGSMPISYQSKKFSKHFSKKYTSYSSNIEDAAKLISFKNFIKICNDNNIQLLLACAPNFGNPSIGFKERMESFSGAGTYLMSYDTSNTVYKNANYYFDLGHLQKNGATIFTAEIVNFINNKKILN